MTSAELAALQAELDEVNDQLAEMVGAPNFSVGSLTIDENTLHQNLIQRKASLEWRIANPNGDKTSTMRVIRTSGAY